MAEPNITGNTEVSFARRTVLAIEDNELNMELLTEILSDEYNVLQAENGKVGLEILQDNLSEVALVLLDVQMPVMNGYEFLKAVKSDPLMSEIPVVVATGNGNISEEEKCLALGANDFVTKPYNARIILSRLASIIHLKESVATMAILRTDERTGLYTMRAFCHYARLTLEKNCDTSYSLVAFDINRFKTIIEMYGEDGSNELLKRVASCFNGYIAAADVFGSFGGAKVFALVESPFQAETDSWLSEMFSAMSEAANARGIYFKAGVYNIEDRSLAVEKMCEHAVTALNSAGTDIGNRSAYYDIKHAEKEKRLARLEADMHEAYETEQFSVYYQPKHDVKTGALVGAEALIRWIHPEYGFLSPGEFIPLFEQNGFVAYADTYVWNRTCRNLAAWREQGVRLVPISVNASKRDFNSEDFLSHRLEAVHRYKLEPSLLHIEVTETLFSERLDDVKKTLQDCRDAGFEIELDDFGSGYSSLNTLALLPLDVIKLDMSFMKNIQDEKFRRVLAACISIAKDLSFKTVCEGVEGREQLDILRDLGCDRVQGYYYSSPIPEEKFFEYMKKYSEGK